MCKFSGIKAENKLEALKRVMSFLCKNVYADEGSTGDATPNVNPAPSLNFEQLIAQARKEEKDKLYPRIKKLEEENAAHVENINGYLIKIGDLTKAVENLTAENGKLKKGDGEESQEVKDLKSQLEALKAENETLKNSSTNESELRKQIEAEYEVKLYAKEQLAENKDAILSTFTAEVTGSTKEEVDEAVKRAIEKSLNIKKELGLVDDKGNQKKPAKNKSGDTNTPTVPQAANPVENSGSTVVNYSAEYIRNLDPKSEEYKEFRKSLGLK